MNMNQITNLLTQKLNLNKDQQTNLSQSIEKAREILNSVNNPTEALSKANVDPSFLNNIRGYLNNPMASMILPMIGLNKSVVLQKIDTLERMMNKDRVAIPSNDSNKSSPYVGGGDDLERFRRGIKSF